MKRKKIDAAELSTLREQVEQRYRSDGGTELEWKSYLPRYEDVNARIRARIQGKHDAAISPNILRRLFWDTRGDEQASFNIVYLNALALYISEGVRDHRGLFAAMASTTDATAPAAEPLHGGVHDQEAPASMSPSSVEEVDHTSSVETDADTAAHTRWDLAPIDKGRAALDIPAMTAAPLNALTLTTEDAQHPATAYASHLPFLAFARPFLIAAVYSGLATFVFGMLFNELSGYERLTRESVRSLMPSLFGTPVFGHLAFGLVLAFLTRWLYRSPTSRHFAGWFLLLSPLLFVATYFGRHVFVRNGWLARGHASPAFFGTPDLETLAITLAFCLWIMLFMVTADRRRPLNDQSRLLRSTVITIACGTVFFVISIAHNILVSTGHLNVDDYFIAPTILNFKFPHPERLPLICFMVFVQTYLTLKFLAERFVERVTPTATNSAAPPHQGFTLP